MATQAGSVSAIQWLLAHGATVDLRNSKEETPLLDSAFCAHPEAIKALLGAGADINLPTGDHSHTAMHNILDHTDTVTSRQIEAINFLLDQGLDINANADSWGSTLACSSIKYGSTRAIDDITD